MRVVNVWSAELEEGPGRDGFWHRGAALGVQLGATRIGAGLYEAREGAPIWPYHYHYPSEEWLYVLQGAPVLRDPSGKRALNGGDLVCFPAGHRGAHTVQGPGRFIIFSWELPHGPGLSVYPDSDKISVYPGFEGDDLNRLLLPRAGSVDYWHGEGNGPDPAAPSPTREPDDAATGPTDRGARQLELAVMDLEPQGSLGPYHYEYGREQWLLVLAGRPSIRHSGGADELTIGDLACFPDGPEGGRELRNHTGEPVRILHVSSTGLPVAVCYPESGEWVLHTTRDGEPVHLRQR